MEITGKLAQILPLQSGEGRNGGWKKQEIILELEGIPPKKLCIGLWNDRIITDIAVGAMLKVSFEIESKEYNNKWYTNLRGLKVEEISSITEIKPDDDEEKEDFPLGKPEEADGLPF